MNTIDLLHKQTEDAYQWTNTLLHSIPYDKWDEVPAVVESSVTWQTGHLIMSFYYHSIMAVAGHRKDVLAQIPIKEYDAYFTHASPRLSVGKVDPEKLLQQLFLMEQKSLEIIRSLSPEDLDRALEPVASNHPIARNKFEALDWNIKHTMWHNGQLGLLRRIVYERFAFDVPRPSR